MTPLGVVSVVNMKVDKQTRQAYAFWNAPNTLNVFMLTLETTPMGAFVDLPCCDQALVEMTSMGAFVDLPCCDQALVETTPM